MSINSAPAREGRGLPVARLEPVYGGGREDLAVGACGQYRGRRPDDDELVAGAVQGGRAHDGALVGEQVHQRNVVEYAYVPLLDLVYEHVHHGKAGAQAVVELDTGPRPESEVPSAAVGRRPVHGDAAIVLALEVYPPPFQVPHAVRGLLYKDFGQVLIPQEAAVGEQVPHGAVRRVVRVSPGANGRARADVVGAPAVSEPALDDHEHGRSPVVGLYGGAASRPAAANDQHVRPVCRVSHISPPFIRRPPTGGPCEWGTLSAMGIGKGRLPVRDGRRRLGYNTVTPGNTRPAQEVTRCQTEPSL